MKEDKYAEEIAFLNEITTVKQENIYQKYGDPQQEQGKKEAVQEEEANVFYS